MLSSRLFCFFFFNDTATTEIYTLSLHDALPISGLFADGVTCVTEPARTRDHTELALEEFGEQLAAAICAAESANRSEEHTSELQSPCNLVCRLLLEKKNPGDPLAQLLRLRPDHV